MNSGTIPLLKFKDAAARVHVPSRATTSPYQEVDEVRCAVLSFQVLATAEVDWQTASVVPCVRSSLPGFGRSLLQFSGAWAVRRTFRLICITIFGRLGCTKDRIDERLQECEFYHN